MWIIPVHCVNYILTGLIKKLTDPQPGRIRLGEKVKLRMKERRRAKSREMQTSSRTSTTYRNKP